MAFIIFLLIVGFYCYAGWRIFEKAGQPGWAALIPFYNAYILSKIVGKPEWFTIVFMIPYLHIWGLNMLSKSFGKDTGFTIGLVFLYPIFIPILAFDPGIVYVGPGGIPTGLELDYEVDSIGKEVV